MAVEELEIGEVRKIVTLINDKYGYDFSDYALSSLKRRIIRFIELKQLNNTEELLAYLEEGHNNFTIFLSEITVNVTEMFRDPTFWVEMKEFILPEMIIGKDHLRIWHAGCSSGEEVFSMAILLSEMGLLDRCSITATDIDNKIIQKAVIGKYPLKNMDVNNKNYIRTNGEHELANYYRVHEDKAIMDNKLLKNISYREHNLVSGDVFSKFDLILCRNVMIYFNQTLQNKVLHKMHESLFSGGILCIGSKESISWSEVADKFSILSREEKIYKKVRD